MFGRGLGFHTQEGPQGRIHSQYFGQHGDRQRIGREFFGT